MHFGHNMLGCYSMLLMILLGIGGWVYDGVMTPCDSDQKAISGCWAEMGKWGSGHCKGMLLVICV